MNPVLICGRKPRGRTACMFSFRCGAYMLRLCRLTMCIAFVALLAVADTAEAGRRGNFGHHSQVRVWHGNRVGNWTHHGHWPRHAAPVSGRWWHAPGPRWNSGWGWSRHHGYPHRWWSWNRRHQARLARRHQRHAGHHWGQGSHHGRFGNEPRRPGVWYASPGFGSTAARGGPVRQGEWHAD